MLRGSIAGRRRCFRSAGNWIDGENPVRVIDAFVDKLDLSRLGFDGVAPEATGRPSYHPSVLLKLYIYWISTGYSRAGGLSAMPVRKDGGK